MTNASVDLTSLFYSGNYGVLVDRALLSGEAAFTPEDTPLVVSSLAALGQAKDAELLLSHQRDLLSPDSLIFALYHLAIAQVAAGKLPEARKNLARAFSFRNNVLDDRSLFFIYQGIAYYRYATGRLSNALRNVHRAGEFARRAASPYEMMLWRELMGHLLVLTGETAQGLIELDFAQTLARHAGRRELLRSLRTAAVIYRSRYVEHTKDALQSLKDELKDLAPGEKYARASLLLELVRQECAARRLLPARQALADASRLVLILGNKRHEASLGLRLLDVLMLSGEWDQSLIVSQSVLRQLDPDADRLLALELWSRRRRILDALDLPEGRDEAARRVRELERVSSYFRPQDPIQDQGKEPLALPAMLVPQSDLNLRQEELIRDLKPTDVIDVHLYRKRFNVSEITACRDLAGLAKLGKLKRLGKARATRYVSPEFAPKSL